MTVLSYEASFGSISWVGVEFRMQWRSLALLLDSRLAKTTGLWFAIVPLLAHVASAPAFAWLFNGIKMPFSWGLFFAAACGIFLARLLFLIFCPTIIKDY